jgi:hypothetical protein
VHEQSEAIAKDVGPLANKELPKVLSEVTFVMISVTISNTKSAKLTPILS